MIYYTIACLQYTFITIIKFHEIRSYVLLLNIQLER